MRMPSPRRSDATSTPARHQLGVSRQGQLQRRDRRGDPGQPRRREPMRFHATATASLTATSTQGSWWSEGRESASPCSKTGRITCSPAAPSRSPTRCGPGAYEGRADRLCRRQDHPRSMGSKEHIPEGFHAMLDPLPSPPSAPGHRMPARRGAGDAPPRVSTPGAGNRMTPGPRLAPVA